MEPARNLTLFLQQSGSIYHVSTGVDGRYAYANDLYRKTFLRDCADIATGRFQDSLLPDDLSAYEEAVARCLTPLPENVAADLRSVRTDGSIFWIRWEFRLFEEGGEKAIEAIGTDITGTKRMETEKKEVQERLVRERYLLRTLIDHLPDAIFVKDMASRHIINNRASLDMLGAATEEETIGKTVQDFFTGDAPRRLIERDQAVMASGRRIDVTEEFVMNRKGEKRWLLTTKIPLKDEQQQVIGLVGIARDVTERKKFEESVRRSIERYNIVSRATNDAIWDWDLITNEIVWNDAVTRLFGYTHEEIGQDAEWWENHIHPDDRERVLSRINDHIQQGIEHWQDEYRFISKFAPERQILDRGFILFDDQHQPYRMIGAMMDITERKKLEDELAANKIARQRQVTEAAIMAQEKERAEMGRELHDNINQILTTTKMYLDMAITEKDIREELMIKSHENISTAIEEIRILSKSLVPPSLGDIGLKEAIQEMINNLKYSQKLDIRLRTSGLSKMAMPRNMKLMIYRIVQEQLNNILKHSQASEAEIRITVARDVLTMVITDNGVGFDTRKRGRGIGLMNITSRAEVHHGVVEVISSPGNGCTIKITIPVKS